MRRRTLLWPLSWTALLFACSGGEQTSSAAPTATPAPALAPAPTAPEERAAPANDEACARVIVVAWQGAEHAPANVTRSEEDARVRAEQLLSRLEAGEDFAEVARAESDARSSGPRGGLIGTYLRSEWPAAHEPIRDAIFALRVGETSPVLHAPYGWVIARRCPVEHVHTRHILIRYAGARNAGPEITRTREEARAIADRLRNQLEASPADFAALARMYSEDASAERGGDVGITGRGRLAEPYEQAAFALQPHEIAGPVETEFGFHVIQRLE
jgi:peptidyl-prolyl cis-trans isomerase SurA